MNAAKPQGRQRPELCDESPCRCFVPEELPTCHEQRDLWDSGERAGRAAAFAEVLAVLNDFTRTGYGSDARCPYCAQARVDAADAERQRSERVNRSLRGALTRLRKLKRGGKRS